MANQKPPFTLSYRCQKISRLKGKVKVKQTPGKPRKGWENAMYHTTQVVRFLFWFPKSEDTLREKGGQESTSFSSAIKNTD